MVPEDLRVVVGAIVAVVAIACGVAGARALEGRTRLVWIGGLAAWLALTGALAARGLVPRVLPGILAAAAIATVAVLRSRIGVAFAGRSLALLVALQAFRLPLELAMHAGAGRGIPIELTLAGYNFDIVTGATAIPIAALVAAGRCPRWLVRAWCLVGLACLVAIAVVAIATLPRFHAFGTDPAHLNTWVTAVPFVWVPALLVPVAVAGHVLVLRASSRLE